MTDARDHGVPIPGALISVTALWPAPKGKTVQATSSLVTPSSSPRTNPTLRWTSPPPAKRWVPLFSQPQRARTRRAWWSTRRYQRPCSIFGLKDGDADGLCLRLNERNIPYVLHSGYTHCGDACRRGIVIPKPAHQTVLVQAIFELLRRPP